jgi:hypothetical protein
MRSRKAKVEKVTPQKRTLLAMLSRYSWQPLPGSAGAPSFSAQDASSRSVVSPERIFAPMPVRQPA